MRPSRLFHALAAGSLAWLGSLLPSTLSAQFAAVPRERTIPTRELVAREVETARYRLGPLRILPRFRLTGGYEDNVFGTSREEAKVSDYTAVVRAGARLVVPAGSRIYLRGDALPEYTWYERLDERRFLGGDYRAAFLAYFNRASLEAAGYTSKNLDIFGFETEARAIQTLQGGEAELGIELLRSLFVYGGGEVRESRYALIASEPDFDSYDPRRLDRTDSAAHAGLRYQISESFAVSAEAQVARSEFEQDPQLRDNQTEGVVGGIRFNRPRLFINLFGGYREGRSYNGSSFPSYSTPTGSYFVSFFLARPVELQAFGQRRVVYGAAEGNPFIISTFNGGAVQVRIRQRFSVRGFGEYGTNNASGPANAANPETLRRDKVTILGAGVSALLFRNVAVTVQGTEKEYVSNIPGRGRKVFYLTTGLSLQGDL